MAEIARDTTSQISDFAYLTTLDEVLVVTIEFLESARRSPDFRSQKFNLSLASRAMRCALEIYRDRAEQEEVK